MRPLLIATAAANVGTSFALQFVVLLSHGASRPTDAFLAIQTVAQVTLAILVGSAINVILPLLSERDDAHEFGPIASGLVILATGMIACLALPGCLTVPLWVPWLLPGFAGEELSLAMAMARVASVGMIAATFSSCLMAMCQARQRNLQAEALQLAATATALAASIALVPHYGVMAATWILTGRALLSAVLLVPLAGLTPKACFRADVLGEAWRRLRPLVWSTACFKASPLIDVHLATRAAAGEYTILNLIGQAFSAMAMVFQRSAVVPAMARLARLRTAGDHQGIQHLVRRGLLLSTVGGLAALIIGVALVPSVLAVANVHLPSAARIDPGRARLLLGCSAGLFLAGFSGQIAAAAFYARGDTGFPAVVGVIGFVTGGFAKVIGFILLGVPGIALGTSLYQLQNTVWLTLHLLWPNRPQRSLPLESST